VRRALKRPFAVCSRASCSCNLAGRRSCTSSCLHLVRCASRGLAGAGARQLRCQCARMCVDVVASVSTRTAHHTMQHSTSSSRPQLLSGEALPAGQRTGWAPLCPLGRCWPRELVRAASRWRPRGNTRRCCRSRRRQESKAFPVCLIRPSTRVVVLTLSAGPVMSLRRITRRRAPAISARGSTRGKAGARAVKDTARALIFRARRCAHKDLRHDRAGSD
jgi:hypothetical protein